MANSLLLCAKSIRPLSNRGIEDVIFTFLYAKRKHRMLDIGALILRHPVQKIYNCKLITILFGNVFFVQ